MHHLGAGVTQHHPARRLNRGDLVAQCVPVARSGEDPESPRRERAPTYQLRRHAYLAGRRLRAADDDQVDAVARCQLRVARCQFRGGEA